MRYLREDKFNPETKMFESSEYSWHLEQVSGDLFDSNAPLLCHQVNCKGVMGAGVAKELKQRYPNVFNAYYKAYQYGELVLGNVIYVQNPHFQIIANLCGQDDYGRDKRYTDYEALQKCFDNVYHFCETNNINRIALPYKMGCGLGGGDWNVVMSLLAYTFGNGKINVELWRK